MELEIKVRACDICKRGDRPATRYTLTPENGEPVTRDLCTEDAAPVEAVFGPLTPAEEPSPEDAFKEQLLTIMAGHERDMKRIRRSRALKGVVQRAPEREEKPAKEAAAAKTAAKKTTAKDEAGKEPAEKKPRRRGRTPVTSLEEIEAKKAAAAKQ